MLSKESKQYLNDGIASTQYGTEISNAIDASSVNEYTTIITSAQLLALNSTPVLILPTPNVGQTIRLLSWDVTFLPGTTPYTITNPNDIIGLLYGMGDPCALLPQAGLLDQLGSVSQSIVPNAGQPAPGGGGGIAVGFDSYEPVLLGATNSPTLGDGALKMRVRFQIAQSL